jgi:hypothetical protein
MLHTFVGADAAAVVAKTRAPYTHYLRENLHLLRGLGASRGRDIDLAALSESERTAFVEFLYDRFVATRALIGTPASCAPLVRRLAAAGASEIACLLDFGATTDDVLAMLPELTAFKAAVAGELRVNLSGPNVHPTGGAETRGRAPEGGHEIVWRPVTLVPQEPVPAEPQAWLVCGDGHGVGASLIERLRARGQSATAWQPGQPVPSGLARVVDLRPLEPGAELAGTVELVQRSTGRLWTVTCGAQAVGGVVPDPMGAAFWGLLRVLPVEQPARWGGLIDLDPSLPAEAQAEALWLALTTSTREDQVALRSGQAAAARLVTAPLISDPALAGFRPRADAAYLITGGLGGVGFAVARWLAAAGARHLVLWGRKAPDAARAADLAALERTGVTVTVRSVDLGDATAVTLALAETPGVPLRGVFHAAGAWQDEASHHIEPARHTRDVLGNGSRAMPRGSNPAAGGSNPPNCRFESPGCRLESFSCRFESPGWRLESPSCRFESPGWRLGSPNGRFESHGWRFESSDGRWAPPVQMETGRFVWLSRPALPPCAPPPPLKLQRGGWGQHARN